MTMRTGAKGAIVSQELLQTVNIKIARDCGERGSDKFSPVFRKGDIVAMPFVRARELVQLTHAQYTDEEPTVDFAELERKADAARKKAKKAEEKAEAKTA